MSLFRREKRHTPRRGLPRLTITAEGPTPASPISVLLDGHDITAGLQKFTLHAEVSAPHKVVMELIAGELDVDVPALRELAANPRIAPKEEAA